jgi:hypothetical protein
MSKRKKQRTPNPAAMAIEHGASLLNNKNLPVLWSTSAALSVLDLYTPFDSGLSVFPFFNHVKLRMLDQIILQSRSSPDKTGTLDYKTLSMLLNDALDLTYDPDALGEISRASTPQKRTELHRLFSLMANTQIAEQEFLVPQRLGRMIAMLEIIPERRSSSISPEILNHARAVKLKLSSLLGGSIKEVAKVFAAICRYYKLSHRHLEALLPPQSWLTTLDPRDKIVHILSELLSIVQRSPYQFTFTSRQLLQIDRSIMETTLDRFFFLFSRNTEILRATQKRTEYQTGHFSSRLLPLDRYPVIELQNKDNEPIRVVPNLRVFLKSLPYAIDYSLLEALGDQYSQVRGFLQELYLQVLLEAKLPDLFVIAERPYGKKERRGPDLTLIERSSRRLILVESKAARMRAGTRTTMSKEDLNGNLKTTYAALGKLPEKLRALYKGLPEYSDVQELIDSTRGNLPLCVVVLSETVYFMSELVRQEALADSRHQMHSFEYPFFVLGLDTFERAVETAASLGKSLSELLEEHWKESREINHNTPPADQFGKFNIPVRDTFAAQFLN